MQLQIEKLGKVSITVEEDYWDINKDYDKLTIVEKEGTFGTFISRKPVPAGTVLTDRKYWIPFSSLKEEIILNFNKWVSDYGALLGSQAETLNHIQELINSIYVHLPNGVVFKGDVDSVRPGFEREIILEGKTINEENAQFILYKNNEEIYRNENSNNFSISDIVNEDTEYKLVTIQNGYKYISTWNVAVALPLYAGGGQTYQDAVGDNKIVKVSNDISGIYSIVIDKDGDYIFFVAPKGYLIKSIKMNGLDVPIKSTKEVYLGTDYVIYQSDYQYKAGTYPIQINDYTGLNGEDFLGILNSLGDTASAVDVANLKERIDNLPVNELIDKEYSPAKFSGMGRVYLRKNIKNSKNILEQDMMLKSNTIYIIQYDFDAEDKIINVPDNSIIIIKADITHCSFALSDNTTIYGYGKSIYCSENKSAITIKGNNCKIYNINIYKHTNNFYGIEIKENSKNTIISECNGFDLSYTFISNDGINTIISKCKAYNCNWDCVNNYSNSYNAIIDNCIAELCGRHGFSTDEGAKFITFKNCTAINIGKILGEGHTCFHFEGAINSTIINCKAVYNSNHPILTDDIDSIFIGARIETGTNNKINGLSINYDNSFNEIISLYPIYINNTDIVNISNLEIVNDSNNKKCYLGKANVILDNIKILGSITFEQASINGLILSISNSYIDLKNTNDVFYNAKYIGDNILINNVTLYNANALVSGRFINSLFQNCVIKNCVTSFILKQQEGNSNEKSENNVIKNNIFINLVNGVTLGWNSKNFNSIITSNIFVGHFSALVNGNNDNAIFINNNIDKAEFDVFVKDITLVKYHGTTNKRPNVINEIGFQYFDTTLGKPIYWTGTKWVDATGSDVTTTQTE